jgi:hypothetical protein
MSPTINKLFAYEENYRNKINYGTVNVYYKLFPEIRPGSYNSNSFTHGLLLAADITPPEPPDPIGILPGWCRPLPATIITEEVTE